VITLHWLAHLLLCVAIFMVLSGAALRASKRGKPDCKTCQYNDGGVCRRFPPQRAYAPPAVDSTVFPVVGTTDNWWCGEYRRR
jgi:hypothetical protein